MEKDSVFKNLLLFLKTPFPLCWLASPLPHIPNRHTHHKFLRLIIPPFPWLAVRAHCLRKEVAKLSCDPWGLIQPEKDWLVTDQSSGIRGYLARWIGWHLAESLWELRFHKDNPMPRLLTQTPILPIYEALSVHYLTTAQPSPVRMGWKTSSSKVLTVRSLRFFLS